MSKKITITIIIAAVLLVGLLVLSGCFFKVNPNEFVVVRQLGKIVSVTDEQGLHGKTPIFQSTERISKEVRFYDIPESDVITKDKKSMVIDNFALWRITDPTAYIRTLNGVELRATERIDAAVYNAVKKIISTMTQDEIIESRGSSLNERITAESNSDITQYGIEIITAQIKTLSLPRTNEQAVFERMISERQNIAAGYIANGDAAAQKIKNETDKEVAVLLADANKKALVLEAEGEEEYMKILQDAYNSEEKAEFYEYIRGLDALKKSFSGSTEKTIILDKDSELVKILNGLN